MEKFKSAMIRSLSTELHLNDSYSVRGKRARTALNNKLNFITTKIASPKRTFEDPFRFSDGGMDFRGKLIGITDVPEPRGERMCQEAMRLLKTIVQNSGRHKQRIIVNVSTDGIKIKDEKFSAVLYTCPVQRISFICRDITDSRAFGFVFGTPGQPHKFYAVKTERTSDITVLAIRDMFQVVFEMKKKQLELAKRSNVDQRKTSDIGGKTEWELFPTTTTTTTVTTAAVDRESRDNQLNELISLEPPPTENGFPHSISTPAVNRVQTDPFFTEFVESNKPRSIGGGETKPPSHHHAEILALYNSGPIQQPLQHPYGTPSIHYNPNLHVAGLPPTFVSAQPALNHLVVDDPFDTSRVKQLLQNPSLSATPTVFDGFDMVNTNQSAMVHSHPPQHFPNVGASENFHVGIAQQTGSPDFHISSAPADSSVNSGQIARPRPTGLAKPLIDINVAAATKSLSPTTAGNKGSTGVKKDPFNDDFFN